MLVPLEGLLAKVHFTLHLLKVRGSAQVNDGRKTELSVAELHTNSTEQLPIHNKRHVNLQ